MQRKIDEVGISDTELIKKLEEKLDKELEFFSNIPKPSMSSCHSIGRMKMLRKELNTLYGIYGKKNEV